jgi:hypothetical protein
MGRSNAKGRGYSLSRSPLRRLTTAYSPQPESRQFLDRVATQDEAGIEVSLSVLSARESESFFGVRMSRRRIQPVWLRVVNGTDDALRLDFVHVDPEYYTPLEAAYVNHFATGSRLLGFGFLAWLFLPFLALIPFKYFGARAANRRIDAFFKKHGFRSGPIKPGDDVSGFIYTPLDEGTKEVDIQLLAKDQARNFIFSATIPGFAVDRSDTEPTESGEGLPAGVAAAQPHRRPVLHRRAPCGCDTVTEPHARVVPALGLTSSESYIP